MRRTVRKVLAAAAITAAVVAGMTWAGPAAVADESPTVPAWYRVVNLGSLAGGTGLGNALALNDRGDVVGMSATAAGIMHPFLWRNGAMTDLGVLDSSVFDYGAALGVNDHGEVVGVSSAAGGTEHAVLWRNGAMVDLGTLGGPYSFAYAINNDSEIVGVAMTAAGAYHGFRWIDGVMTDLGVDTAMAINDRGQITGGMTVPDGYHAYRWSRDRFTDLGTTTGTYSEGMAINQAGWVAGRSGSLTLPGYSGAFLCRDGAMVALADLGGGYSDAFAINDHGLVLGTSSTAFDGLHNVIWRGGTVIDLAERGIVPAGMLTGAGPLRDINNSAQIAGTYYFTEGQPSPALFTR